eukprot:TRINITY_DN37777_c0_g1_i1.p1 TRINITY_DN37777_c0_g1~~TRINITY_DN37777_c0_g1_i1.p1  ORF type:complete len:142 (-),score=41.10 TRINITY_DN37777_c0_g1_i1:294-719(-)
MLRSLVGSEMCIRDSTTTVRYYEDVSVDSERAHQRDGNGPNYDELLRQSVVSILLAIAACVLSAGAAYINWSRRVVSAEDDDDDAHVDKANAPSAPSEKKAALKHTLAAQHSTILGKTASNAQLRTTTSDVSDDESHDDDD